MALLGGLHRQWRNRNIGAALARGVEGHGTVSRRENGVVAAKPGIVTRVIDRAALAHEDVAGIDELAAEFLNAEATALGIAPVARRAACFLMGHAVSPLPLSR